MKRWVRKDTGICGVAFAALTALSLNILEKEAFSQAPGVSGYTTPLPTASTTPTPSANPTPSVTPSRSAPAPEAVTIEESEEAALLAACGIVSPPAGNPIRKGQLNPGWTWGDAKLRDKYEFSKSKHAKTPFTNPVCEQYVMKKLLEQGNKNVVKDRCQYIKKELFENDLELQNGSGDTEGAFGGLSSLLSASKTRGSDTTAEGPCDSEDSAASTPNAFACNYLSYKEQLDGNSLNKASSREVLNYCSRLGADMRPHMTLSEYRSLSNSGVDIYGNGYCSAQARGGIVIQERENKWYDTVANMTLGMTKVLAPIASMTYSAQLQQKNAHDACAGNQALGFPCILTAGQNGGAGVGALYGAQGSCGACGNHYSGLNGMLYGGGAYSGYGGGCPTGACYGNGGVVVGGTGVGYAGGMYGGGSCGLPPFAQTFAACGAGGGGVFTGGCATGTCASTCQTGLCGGGVYAPFGNGQYSPSYYNGVYGPGYGAGMPGGGGYYGNGYNPYGGYGGYGAGGYGPGGYGANGAAGMPGPYGTLNGNNGYGGPNGYTGAAGQPSYWGAEQPFNAQAAQMQAQMYQAYAAQVARQAQQTAQAAKLYDQSQADAKKASDKSYQAYMAYQMAQMGYTGGASIGGYGGVPVATNTNYYGAGGGGGYYYPPMQSGLTGGRNLSIGVSANFGR